MIALSALLLATSGPALAQGKMDRARIAVAEARAKVEAATKLTGSGEFPRLQADAQATLRTAEEHLAATHKDQAIATANEASRLADTAIGLSQRDAAAQANVQTRVAVDAQSQAADAQAQAADANARAQAAEQAAAAAQAQAAAAQADAAAARAAPPAAPVTTITTETTKTAATAPVRTSARTPLRRPVKKAVRTTTRRAPATTEKTTTTVTTRTQ